MNCGPNLDFGFNDAEFLLMTGSVALNLTKSVTYSCEVAQHD